MRGDAQSQAQATAATVHGVPYGAHCALVALIYFGGIRVIGKPREGRDCADLEHLKHLPFVDVFVSDEKLVRWTAAPPSTTRSEAAHEARPADSLIPRG